MGTLRYFFNLGRDRPRSCEGKSKVSIKAFGYQAFASGPAGLPAGLPSEGVGGQRPLRHSFVVRAGAKGHLDVRRQIAYDHYFYFAGIRYYC